MTSMTTPPPVAEFVPTGGAGEAPGLRTLLGEAALPRTADFAALLQDAGLAAPPLVAAENPRAPEERAVDRRNEDGAASSVVDGILFLSVVQAPVVANAPISATATMTQAAAESRTAIDAAVVDKRLLADSKFAPAPAASTPADGAEATTADEAAPPPPSAFASALPHADETFAAASDAKRDAVRADKSLRPAVELVNAASSNAQPASQRSLPEAATIENDRRTVPTKGVEPTGSLSVSQGATAPPPVTLTIETPVHDASWRVDAATRIASLVTRGVEHAEVRVTPPDLGPVELRIDVRGGEATLAIVATQATTRDALEQALPMLRDMLAQQGLSLGQATVADGRAESQSGGNGASPQAGVFAGNAGLEEAAAARPARSAIARGLIDVFA